MILRQMQDLMKQTALLMILRQMQDPMKQIAVQTTTTQIMTLEYGMRQVMMNLRAILLKEEIISLQMIRLMINMMTATLMMTTLMMTMKEAWETAAVLELTAVT